MSAQSSSTNKSEHDPWEEQQRLNLVKDLWELSHAPLLHLLNMNSDTTNNSPARWMEALGKITCRLGCGTTIGLIGLRGRGKTQMAVHAMDVTIGQGRPALYTTAMDMFVATCGAFKGVGNERQILDTFISPRLLVIDETQNRGNTDYEDRTLANIIDRRYSEKRDTIIIANLQPKEFDEAVGPSIVSRIDENGGIIECTWPSFRKTT